MASNNKIKNHLQQSLNSGVRYDGRGLLNYRNISVTYGVSKTAEGSAEVSIGDTRVIVGVKLEVGKPYPDTPDQGAIVVNAEFLPMANPDFESGPPGIDSIELARIVDRGIRESKAIDLKKLCITKGELCWVVSIDVITINDDGNLIDASALGALAALKNTKFPEREGNTVTYKKLTNEKLPLGKMPIAVTVLKLGDNLIVDPLGVEYECLSSRLTITTTQEGTICALQKGGNEPLSLDDIKKMIEIALDKSKELRNHLK